MAATDPGGIELRELAAVALPPSHTSAATVLSAYEPPDDGPESGTLEACALRQLRGHDGHVWCAAFHPEVPLLATGGSDRTVRLWRLDGTCTRVLRGHEEWVYCCAFHPTGETLCSGPPPPHNRPPPTIRPAPPISSALDGRPRLP